MSAIGICRELVLVLHLVSAHGAGGEHLNNQNPGAGMQCRAGSLSAGIGAYENSFRHTSVYAVGGWEPLRIGAIRIGAIAGIASGYEEEWDSPLIGGLRIRYQRARFEAAVLAVPPAGPHVGFIHFMIGRSF